MYFLCENQHLEIVIRQRIPSIISLINKTIDELNAELDRIGRPIGSDGGVSIQHESSSLERFVLFEILC